MLADPEERPRRVDFGAPTEHLLYIEPILGPVEDGLADDQVLGGEDRDVHRSKPDHPGALGHLEVQVHGGEEHIEIGAVPVEPGLPVAGDGGPVLGGDGHAEPGQHLEDGRCGLGRHRQIDVDVGGRPRDCGTRSGRWPPRTGAPPRRNRASRGARRSWGPGCRTARSWSTCGPGQRGDPVNVGPGRHTRRRSVPVRRPQAGQRREPQRLGSTGRPKGRHLGDEVQEVDEGVARVPRAAGGGRTSSAAAIRREDSTNCCISGRRWRGRRDGGRCAGPRRALPYRLGVEGPGGPSASGGQHFVGEAREAGQRAGPRAVGGVHRLADLEAALGTGDHVCHAH